MDFSRNIGVLTTDQQAAITDCRLLVVGCGLGSVVAELAARTGFADITVIDGDTVAASNLNRQAYVAHQVASGKAGTTALSLSWVNPSGRFRACEYFMRTDDCAEEVARASIIIDTIDLSSIDVMLALHREARRLGKPVVFPLNLAFGTGLFVFGPESTSLDEMIGTADATPEQALELYKSGAIFESWIGAFASKLPGYAVELLGAFVTGVKERGWCPLPQVGIAAWTSAALTVAAATRLACSLPCRQAPELITIDPWSLLAP